MSHIMTFAVMENPEEGDDAIGSHGVFAHSDHDPENDEIVFSGSAEDCRHWILSYGRSFAEGNGYICEADAKHLYTREASPETKFIAGDRHDNDPPMDYYRSLKR